MDPFVSSLSFWFAITLSLGSLLFYLSGAIWNRPVKGHSLENMYDFNLGLPKTSSSERLFAVSLVAAGTSLSTVFVFFLTSAKIYGWWLVLSPILFALGNLAMFWTYRRIRNLGYFEEAEKTAVTGAAGLVPYIAQCLTGKTFVGWLLVALSLLNLFAVLVLELVVGAEVLGYLATQALNVDKPGIGEFVIFCISVALLIGYVFIGGFRAVIISDKWQVRAIKWAVLLTLFSLIVFGFSTLENMPNLGVLGKSPPSLLLWGFLLNVMLANLLVPLSQEASWQRFRAFANSKKFKFKDAILKSMFYTVALWLGLICLAFTMQLVIPTDAQQSFVSMSSVLEALRTLNTWWFPLFVFPVFTFATLSAMFSTSDTNISAIFFVVNYAKFTRSSTSTDRAEGPFSKPYILALCVFLFSVVVYAFARMWFHPTILQLVFSVFSNLVVIAPTVITAAILKPLDNGEESKFRVYTVYLSLSFGFLCYWCSSIIAMILGEDYLWLSQLSIAIGLLGALLPCIPLWVKSIFFADCKGG